MEGSRAIHFTMLAPITRITCRVTPHTHTNKFFACFVKWKHFFFEYAKVDMFNFVHRTPIFKLYMVRCGSEKNKWHNVLIKSVRLPISKPSSHHGFNIFNIIGGDVYGHLMIMRIFNINLIETKIFIWTPHIIRLWLCFDLNLLSISC